MRDTGRFCHAISRTFEWEVSKIESERPVRWPSCSASLCHLIRSFFLITSLVYWSFFPVRHPHCVSCLPTRDVWADRPLSMRPAGASESLAVIDSFVRMTQAKTFSCKYSGRAESVTWRRRMGWPITNRGDVFNGVFTYKKIPFLFRFPVTGTESISIPQLFRAGKSYYFASAFAANFWKKRKMDGKEM
jgi:hypothetical protein